MEGQVRENQRRLPGGSYVNLESLGRAESQAKKREDGASMIFQAEEVAHAVTEVRRVTGLKREGVGSTAGKTSG